MKAIYLSVTKIEILHLFTENIDNKFEKSFLKVIQSTYMYIYHDMWVLQRKMNVCVCIRVCVCVHVYGCEWSAQCVRSDWD